MKFLLAFLISAPVFAEVLHVNPMLINGTIPEAGSFPEIIMITGENSQGRWSCSATVVAENVLMTAAHCVGGRVSHRGAEVKCEAHPEYRDNDDADIALCLTKVPFRQHPVAVAKEAPIEVGDKVLLTGYGCTSSEGDGVGTLRIGESTVYMDPDANGYYFQTFEDAALCFGDSGGPSYKLDSAGNRKLIGVNSRGNIRDFSLMTAVWTAPIAKFIKAFGRKHQIKELI